MGIVSWSNIKLLYAMVKSYTKTRQIAVLITDKLQIIFRNDIWVIRCSKLKKMGLLHSDLKRLRDLCNATDRTQRQRISISRLKEILFGIRNDYSDDDSVTCFDDLEVIIIELDQMT